MVTSLLLGPPPMQDFCEFCGRDGLALARASGHALRGRSVPFAGMARPHMHFDYALPTQSETLSLGANVVFFADLPDRARLKQAA